MKKMTEMNPTLGPPSLTRKQREILSLLAQGHDRKNIMARLKIATRTVQAHLSALYAAYEVESLLALQARLGVLERIPLKDGRIRLGTTPRD